MTLRVYGQLNDFLPAAGRGTTLARRLDGSPAVKDVIEAAGVPHPEVALVLVDGKPVGFEHRLAPGARVAVYPAFRSIDLGETVRPGPPPPDSDDARFALDGDLGRLAAYLRMAGFDTWYERAADDDALARIAADDDRTLLTRDRGLLKRSIVARGAFVRADRPAEQLVEILDRFDLAATVRPFARCLRCNPPSCRSSEPPPSSASRRASAASRQSSASALPVPGCTGVARTTAGWSASCSGPCLA